MREAAPKHRWPCVTLRTLFVVVAIFGSCLGWIGWNVRRYQEREAALARIAAVGGIYVRGIYDHPGSHPDALPWAWRLIGIEPIAFVWFTSPDIGEEECRRIGALFPEAEVDYSPAVFAPAYKHKPPPRARGAG